MTWIALAARAAAQLIVNATAFVPLGAKNIETAGSECLFLQPRNLFTDFVGPGALLAFPLIVNVAHFLANAHIGIAAELNVGASTRHIGGDRDRARHAGLCDDVGLLLVVTRIENGEYFFLRSAFVSGIQRREGIGIGKVVLFPTLLTEQLGELFGFLNRRSADKNRLAASFAILDEAQDRPIFLRSRAVDL